MGLHLDQILTLTGTLDDAPGFDAARERFRRFLIEFVTTPADLVALIDQAQHAPGDQHARALQDLVVLVGRVLGFDVTFAPVTARSGASRPVALWRSPRQALVVAVPAARTPRPTPRDLARALETFEAAGPRYGRVDALVVLPPFAAATLDPPAGAALALAVADEREPVVRMSTITLASLIALADLVATGRLSHADLVQVLETGTALDGLAGVLARTAAPAAAPGREAAPAAESTRPRTGCWISIVVPDQAMTPEEFLEVVVARRHVYGIAEAPDRPTGVRPGDQVCFCIRDKGVVGDARVAATLEGGGTLRDARRFRQVLRLERVHLYLEAPVGLDPETTLRLRRAPASVGRLAPSLVEISAESYREFTTSRGTSASAAIVPFEPVIAAEPSVADADAGSAGDGREHDRNVL